MLQSTETTAAAPDPIKSAIASRSIQEDQRAVATQWAKTFWHTDPGDPAIHMVKLLMAAVALGDFRTKTYLSKNLERPSDCLTIADYLSHASRIIIDYQGLSEAHQAEFLDYFNLEIPGLTCRSATHAVRRNNKEIIEDKGLMLGVVGQAPTYLKTPYDFGINIPMGGENQQNFYGKTISNNGYSGHVYFHRNDYDKLLMSGLEQSAPAASFLELFSFAHQEDNNVQQSVDQFGQGHSLVGSSDTFTAAGSLYFSDPIYQAKLLAEHHILPPDKYGAMQVVLTDNNWLLIKDFLDAFNKSSFDSLFLALMKPPASSVRQQENPFSYIQLDFSSYLKQIFQLWVLPSTVSEEYKNIIRQQQADLLICIKALQSGSIAEVEQFITLINDFKNDNNLSPDYKNAIARIFSLFELEFKINKDNKVDQNIDLQMEKVKHKLFLEDLHKNLHIEIRDTLQKALRTKEFYESTLIERTLPIVQFLSQLNAVISNLEATINPNKVSNSMTGSWMQIVSPAEITEETIRDLSNTLDQAKSALDNSPKLGSTAFFLDYLTEQKFTTQLELEQLRENTQRLQLETTRLKEANESLEKERQASRESHRAEIEELKKTKASEHSSHTTLTIKPDTHQDLTSVFVKSNDDHQLLPLHTTPKKSIAFKEWFTHLIFHPSMIPMTSATTLRTKIGDIHDKIFFHTYAADGYDLTAKTITATEISRDGLNTDLYSWEALSKSVGWPTFFGLPARPRLHERARVSWLQLGKNFLGGWQPLFDWSKGLRHLRFIGGKRALWQIPLLIFVKIPIILPLKIIGVPLKFALNMAKLVTEFLPAEILYITGYIISHVPKAASRVLANSRSSELGKLGRLLLLILATFILLPIHFAARILFLIGTAATSPEKSARKAFAYGRSLQVGNETSSAIIGTILGIIGATLSVAMTATIWALTFPILFAKIIVLIPALIPLLTSVSQVPIVASTLIIVKGALTTLGAGLITTLTPTALALSAFIGAQITATTLTFALIICAIAAPVLAIASRVADELSNAWARWTSIASTHREHESSIPLDTLGGNNTLSASARTLVTEKENGFLVVNGSMNTTDKQGEKATGVSTYPSDQQSLRPTQFPQQKEITSHKLT